MQSDLEFIIAGVGDILLHQETANLLVKTGSFQCTNKECQTESKHVGLKL